MGTSDSSEGLELRSTHFVRRTKDPKLQSQLVQLAYKLPSKQLKD